MNPDENNLLLELIKEDIIIMTTKDIQTIKVLVDKELIRRMR